MNTNRISKWFAVCTLMVMSCVGGALAQSLSMHNFSVASGGTTQVTIDLIQSDVRVLAFQADLELPDGLQLQGTPEAVSGTLLNASGAFVTPTLSYANSRMVVYNNNKQTFAKDSSAVVTLSFIASSDFEGGIVTLRNIVLSGENNQEITQGDVVAQVSLRWDAPVEPTRPVSPEDLEFIPSDIEAGNVYYIRNAGCGQFITGGNSWATQISLGINSLPYLPIIVDEEYGGGYTLTPVSGTYTFIGTQNRVGEYTMRLNGSSQKLFRDTESNGFVDMGTQNSGYVWNITKVGNYYRIQTSENDPGFYNWPNYQEQYAGATEPGTPVRFNLTEGDAGIDWEFILADDIDWDAVNAATTQYEEAVAAYETAMQVYDARIILYEMLLDAKQYGVATAEANRVYNNADATLADIQDAIVSLRQLVREAILANINANPDVETPVNLTKYFMVNADLSDGNMNGWKIEGEKTSYGNYRYLGDTYTSADSTVTINGFIETWTYTQFLLGDLRIYQNVSGLPAGHYVFECDALALNQEEGVAKEDYTGAYLYYSDGNITLHGDALASDIDNIYNEETGVWSSIWRPSHFVFEFDLNTTSDSIALGIMTDNTNLNWIAADNFKLSYLGTKEPDDLTVGVVDIAPAQATGSFYTIDGRRVARPTKKGLYIINGKKVVVK